MSSSRDGLLRSSELRRSSARNIVKSASVVASAATTPAASGDVVARVLGYSMGAGSLLLYSPIILKLLDQKRADGFSHETWIFTLIGLTAGVLYPFKKGFPISTYVEILILSIQSFGILGLVCSYKDMFREYVLGMGVYLAVVAALFKFTLTPSVLNSLQWVSMLVCNYAAIPQIMLTHRTQKASWSPITSLMSMVGNSVRVFTTLQLTGDKLVLGGNLMGLVCNVTLLVQSYLYRHNKD